jgi:hypothetical protein
MSVAWEITPFEAVTTNAYVPVEGELSAVNVRVEDALLPAGTVTGLGRLKVTPYGARPVQAADKLMVELNPFTDERRMVVDLERPGVKVIMEGKGWVMKSGVASAGVTVTQRPTLCV